MKRKKSFIEAGFSLFEGLLVLAILGWLSTLALPTFQGWQQKIKYLQQLENIHSLFSSAQQKALHEHRDYWVGLEPNCFWLHSQETGNCIEHAQLTSLHPLNIQGRLAQENKLRFTASRGFSGFGAGHIRISHPGFPNHEVRYVVSALGRVRMCQMAPLFTGMGLCV